jgi:hypothetical protein
MAVKRTNSVKCWTLNKKLKGTNAPTFCNGVFEEENKTSFRSLTPGAPASSALFQGKTNFHGCQSNAPRFDRKPSPPCP